MNAVRQFLKRVKAEGAKRPGSVTTVAMGRERVFVAYDVGDDTFIFERGVSARLDERPSVLMVDKRDLRPRARGRVMTMSTGNHSVAAFPLLDGRFWGLSRLPRERRSEVLSQCILCANVVSGRLEVSQREILADDLVRFDDWLRHDVGFGLQDVVMAERDESTLEHYRACGQEWRVKPLAWTEREMSAALAASRKRISSSLSYYHSSRGVHFLSTAEFRRLIETGRQSPAEFMKGLKELVSVYEDNATSFLRMPKHRGHHEIEFFGLRRNESLSEIVPELERLMEAVELGRVAPAAMLRRAEAIADRLETLLSRPELADESSKAFIETMYIHITGEIYAVVGDGATPAFDDRRTALPGATFVGGRPEMHPGSDARTAILLSNLSSLVSKDETVEYANVYELRTEDEDCAPGEGKTREIVYKTDRSPLERSLVAKCLSQPTKGCGSYMLSRVQALKGLGVNLSEYRILRRERVRGQGVDFYIRRRCEGEPVDDIPASYFRGSDDGSGENPEVVLALAALMGDAAAQNMASKKYDPNTNSPLFGVGKEIYEFEYDIRSERVTPKAVSMCSVRGSFGWPDLSQTDENLAAIGNFYFGYYAHALKDFARKHAVPMDDLAARFMDGFEFRTHAMEWKLSVMRDKFEAFRPHLPAAYDFDRKWRFVMWSLERQERRLPLLKKLFFRKVELVRNEDIRNNPQ